LLPLIVLGSVVCVVPVRLSSLAVVVGVPFLPHTLAVVPLLAALLVGVVGVPVRTALISLVVVWHSAVGVALLFLAVAAGEVSWLVVGLGSLVIGAVDVPLLAVVPLLPLVAAGAVNGVVRHGAGWRV
jgi:hypothetical protein